jgi:putative FmdB family regulatory protein
MPIFEYKCKCGKVFEALNLPAKENEQIKCPECGGIELTKLISKPFLPNSVGAPADLRGSSACCGGKPENQGCTPGSCCGDTAEKGLEH